MALCSLGIVIRLRRFPTTVDEAMAPVESDGLLIIVEDVKMHAFGAEASGPLDDGADQRVPNAVATC